MEDKIVKKSVAFAKQDIGVVSAFARQNGLSFSSALRMIIRRWEGLEDRKYGLTVVGVEKLEGPEGADRPVLVLVEEKK